jgi:alkylation response protein AidB-like acyl-CoA dehydrogenase
MRAHAVRTLASVGGKSGPDPSAASVAKLLWAHWHRDLGELAMQVRGAPSLVHDGDLDEWQRMFLFTRADTIYGGSDEVQRNIIAERTLGLPREVRA